MIEKLFFFKAKTTVFTCLAAAISFSSLLLPCTRLFAASQSECVAAATMRAADTKPSDH